MSPQFDTKVYNHLIVLLNLLFSVWLTYCSGLVVNNTGIQCAVSERVALLHFKQGISVDNCGLLYSWGDGLDCCQWSGIQCINHSGHVIGLRLPGTVDPYYDNGKACLEGTLNDSLLELKHLKYLDLSYNNFQGRIPKFIGSLSSLEYLNLSNARFMGVVPQEIGNLSRLSSLDLNLGYGNPKMRVESLRWLSHLRLLKQLDLSHIDLSRATNTWLPIVNGLPFLQVLRLDKCQLSFELPPPLSYINSSSTLKVISLSYNNMNNMPLFQWLSNLKGRDSSLEYLDLSGNQMFGNDVNMSGHSVKFLGNLCSLQTLDLSDTNLKYDFSKIVQSFSVCPGKALASLDLSDNQVWGSIPDNINTLSSLRVLELSDNQLNGTISQALRGLPRLEILDLFSNTLKGVVTEEHLSNLSKLRVLDLSLNKELVVNISANWIPPFQLDILYLSNCKVGPDFLIWLTTQKHLTYISLDSTGISGTIPVSFFNSLSSKLMFLSMSKNMMYGSIPDVSIIFDVPPSIDLSSNKFHGAIPQFMRNVSALFLSNNRLSRGLVPLLCPKIKTPLVSLDLSNNLFSDKLPDCWEHTDELRILNLQNNKLWGSLSTSIGTLDKLNILHLNHNNISGELPSSLVNCKSLVILDLSHNSLTGYTSSIFSGSFKNLSILMLQSNNFHGTLPSSFCQLSQIQILDLSNNFISGIIPRCIYNLQGMASTKNMLENITANVLGFTITDPYDGTVIMWKRRESFFQGYDTLGQAKTIDFANNKLEGHIPEGISSLIGLMTINLSRNHLIGAIPTKIGQLTSLETLDLSHNHLSGEIPLSLAENTNLGVLDLSYNNLCGKIPTGPQLQTFNSSTYMGNPQLCGAPLLKCEEDEVDTTPRNNHIEQHLDDFMLGVYISVVLGFITGFWGVCGSLIMKRTWRHAFFRFYENMKDKIYVVVVVHVARVWRRA